MTPEQYASLMQQTLQAFDRYTRRKMQAGPPFNALPSSQLTGPPHPPPTLLLTAQFPHLAWPNEKAAKSPYCLYQPQQLTQLWWLLDPRDAYGCCEECRRLAAGSPYDPPWTNKNVLRTAPGALWCGDGCTCQFAYVPPEAVRWAPFEMLSAFDQELRRTPQEKRPALFGY